MSGGRFPEIRGKVNDWGSSSGEIDGPIEDKEEIREKKRASK